MPGTMTGKVAVVTGGSSGIGRATCLCFAREGATVVLAARRVPEGEQTAQMVRDAGGAALFVRADVSHAAPGAWRSASAHPKTSIDMTERVWGKAEHQLAAASLQRLRVPRSGFQQQLRAGVDMICIASACAERRYFWRKRCPNHQTL